MCAQLPNPRRVTSSLEVSTYVFGGGEENGEGKGGKPLERENIFSEGNEKRRKKKNVVFGREEKAKKEKEDIIWRRKIYFLWRRRKTDIERRKNLEKKNVFLKIVQRCC